MTNLSHTSSLPSGVAPQSPLDTAALARMASALFAALPGESPDLSGAASALPRPATAGFPPGVQAPVNLAPAGSPLASPAGLGPSVPGTPIPQGQIPGSNLLPASPTPVLSLAHRAPALVPHASAGNGVPDTVVSTLPAYEPRLGSGVLGVVPVASLPSVPSGASAPYYFVGERPSGAGRAMMI